MNKINTRIARAGIVALLLFAVSALSVLGQTPTTFNYQAVLRDATGHILESTNVSIQLVVHQGTSTGTTVYSEVHNTTTSEFGLVNLEVGSVTPASFALIDWAAGPYFVEVIVNGTSMGTSELLTVPYALFAETANISGTEPVFNGWDKNEADDFNGVFGSLSGIPPGLSDGDDNTQLNEAQVEAFINGDETSFDGWDKNAANDFSGNYNDLINLPDLSDMISIANPQNGDIAYYSSGNWHRLAAATDGEVLSLNGGVPEWRFYGSNRIQTYFQFVTFRPGYTSPIAFGFISPDGSISSGSGNFTCTWNPSLNRYEITITGHSYFWTNFSTVVTLAQQSNAVGAIAKTGSVSGMLLIFIER